MPNVYGKSILERIIGAGTYLFCGLIGIIWLVLTFLLKKPVSYFLQYHIKQSIIFWLGLYVLNLLFSIIIGFLIHIPVLKYFIVNILNFFTMPIYSGFSIIQAFISIIVLYLMLGALLGRYSYLPFISEAMGSRRD